jgi:thiol-disulfide isomerase/thioredoxin
LASKPVVDGLEREFEGKARVVRANIQSGAGRTLADRYDVDVVPSFVVFDRDGKIVFKKVGASGVPLDDVRRALRRG